MQFVKSRRLQIAVSLVLLIGTLSWSQQSKTTESVPSHASISQLLDGSCAVYKSTTFMPETLKDAFAKLTRQNTFELAKPREPFQVGDVVMGPELPFRGLILAGRCKDALFIHYERGGRAHTMYLVVFRSDREQLTFAGGTSGIQRATNLEELRKSIIGEPFTTDPRCCW
jgi:hypothetical protein